MTAGENNKKSRSAMLQCASLRAIALMRSPTRYISPCVLDACRLHSASPDVLAKALRAKPKTFKTFTLVLDLLPPRHVRRTTQNKRRCCAAVRSANLSRREKSLLPFEICFISRPQPLVRISDSHNHQEAETRDFY